MKASVTLFVSAIDLKDGKAPASFVLFKAGWNELEDGPRYFVDEESYRLIKEYWTKRGIKIVIDYEHQTLSGDQAPAAGWITVEGLSWDPALGIVAAVEWTEKAAEYIANKEYLYFSPVFTVRKSDNKLVGLYSVALTNNPRHNDLQALAAKLGVNNQNKEEHMEFFTKLFSALGLAAGASEQDVLVAIATIAAKARDVREVITKEVTSALGLNEGSDTNTVVASILALKQKPEGMVSRDEFEAVAARLKERDVQDAMTKWASKMTPATKDEWLKIARKDLAEFEAIMAKMPDAVPTAALPGKTQPGDAVDDATLQVAKIFGVTADDLKTYGGVA